MIQKNIDHCFENSKKFTQLAIAEQLKTIKIVLESLQGIKSFNFESEEEGDDEGGTYIRYYISALNTYPVYFSPSNFEDTLESDDFWNDDMRKIAFESKIKEADLELEVNLLSKTLSRLNQLATNQITSGFVDIEYLNKQIIDLGATIE